MSAEPLTSEPVTVPVLGAGRLVLFPAMRCSLHLGPTATRELHAALELGIDRIAVFAGRIETPAELPLEQLHSVGTLAQVKMRREPCCGRLAARLEGMGRVRRSAGGRVHPFRVVVCAPLHVPPPTAEDLALAIAIRAVVARIRDRFGACQHARDAHAQAAAASDPETVLGAVGPLLLALPAFQRQRLLELEPLGARLEVALGELHEVLGRVRLH
jgi:Lon protease-like protein